MRYDILDQLSVQQALSGSSAQVSTNSKQKTEPTQDLGIGKEMGIYMQIDQGDLTISSATSLTLEIIEATNAALSSGVKSLASKSILVADLIDGAGFFLPLPPYVMSEQFFGARYTPVGGSIAGAVNCYFGSKDDFAKFKSFKTPYVVKNS